ncbi:MAG: hypothetical protein JWP85_1326 [Rhodoglobus sp.]|nr:hypothetical protein [Rhodoglobus sp.]
MQKQKFLATLAAIGLMASAMVGIAAPAMAGNDGVCPVNSTDHIDPGDGIKEVTYTTVAPVYIIGYCVKAGSAEQELGPVEVSVDPTTSITFSYPLADKDISHYSILTATDVCLDDEGYQSDPAECTVDEPDPEITSGVPTTETLTCLDGSRNWVTLPAVTGGAWVVTLGVQNTQYTSYAGAPPLGYGTYDLSLIDLDPNDLFAVTVGSWPWSAVDSSTLPCLTAGDPTFEPAVCAVEGSGITAGTYTVVAATGVRYEVSVDGATATDVLPGTYEVDTFPTAIVITAFAIDPSQLLAEPSTWSFTFVSPGTCTDEEQVKYSICHATEVVNAKNGWLALPPLPVSAIVSGHENHSGDIIPVINPEFPNGQNLTTVYPQQGNLTGAQILAGGCNNPDPDVATAAVSFIDATCVAGEKLILGAVSNASWGSATDLTGPQAYSFAATANAGAEFADGDPGDPTVKTFEGSLDGPLPANDPACDLPTFDLVMPQVSSVQPTCTAAGSYTLGAAAGYNPAYVKWTVDGVTDVPSGTYAVTTSRIVTIVAVPVAPHGFEFGWVQPAPIGFTVPGSAACDDLPTLAFTGSTSGSDAGLLIAGGLLFMGIAGVYARRRLVSRSE